jgi:hypothetical protein
MKPITMVGKAGYKWKTADFKNEVGKGLLYMK